MKNVIPKLLMLDKGGIPIQWADYETYVYHSVKGNILWEMGEADIKIRGGVNAETGLQTNINASSIFAINGKRSKGFYQSFGSIPLNKKNKDLFNRDGNLCAYCGEVYTNKELSRDHVHPVSRGGKDEWTNVVTSCKVCNQRKDDLLLSESGMSLLYVPYAPNRAEKLILENRMILADQMEYLLEQVPKDSKLHN